MQNDFINTPQPRPERRALSAAAGSDYLETAAAQAATRAAECRAERDSLLASAWKRQLVVIQAIQGLQL